MLVTGVKVCSKLVLTWLWAVLKGRGGIWDWMPATDFCRGMPFATRIVEKFLGTACEWKSPTPTSKVPISLCAEQRSWPVAAGLPLLAVKTATATAVTVVALSDMDAAPIVTDAALIEAAAARRVGTASRDV
jgi:hypothetical protein